MDHVTQARTSQYNQSSRVLSKPSYAGTLASTISSHLPQQSESDSNTSTWAKCSYISGTH